MNNSRKIALGLAIAGLAFGFSAFTNAKKQSSVNFGFLVQRSSGAFTQVNVANDYEEPNYLACVGTSDKRCTYIVTSAGKTNMPTLSSLGQSFYTSSQIDSYLIASPNAWIAMDSQSGNGIYDN